ncbi:MAG: efflux RND transporter permease subunit [Gammaproteobacteria bacterium]
MNITRFAIEKNRITGVVLAVILVAGTLAYSTMPRSEDPGFIIRTAVVKTYFPGASPERVELLVTDKLEKKIQEIPELDFVSSTSKVGVSIIYVNIKEEYRNMRPLWDKLRRKVEDTIPDLPDDIIGPFVNDEFGDVFGTIITVTGEGFSYREIEDFAEEVREELLLLPDVAKVEIFGAQEEQIFVEYDNATLAKFGLSPVQLQQGLAQRNIILPGGEITTAYEEIVLEPTGNFETLEDLQRTVVNLPNTRQVIRLEDLVDIYRGYADPPESLMRSTGLPALGLAVSMRDGGNILELGKQIQETIRRARGIYPIGIEFDYVAFQADVVERKVDDFVGNLLQAVVVVAVIMLLFLGLRTGLIVASLIPATMVTTFLIMSFFDIGLNQMSLASLIIALGMLVDNAIVMSESIMVRMEHGVPAQDAAIKSTQELRLPLLISSLTTSAAFLPIFLAESATGEYTAPLFKVVTIALLTSWVMALTLIPVLCVVFLKVRQLSAETAFSSPIYTNYRKVLLAAVRRPWLVVAAVVVTFMIAVQGFRFVPNIFFPENDQATMTVDVDLPVGSPIERTDLVVRDIERFMLENLMAGDEQEGIINWGTFVGEGAPRYKLAYQPQPPSPYYGFLVINATSIEAVQDKLIPAIEKYIIGNFPEVSPTVRALPLGAPAWPPVAIRISGRDTDQLFEIVDQVKDRVAEIPGSKLVTDNWGTRSKKIIVEIDATRAQLAGISHQDVAVSLQTHLSGFKTAEFREGDKLIPVVLRSKNRRRGTQRPGISSANVYSQATGYSVPVEQVSELKLVWQPAIIERRDRLRTVTVESLLSKGYTASELNSKIRPWLEQISSDWAFGYLWEFGGEAETSGKANASIAAKIPIAALIILLLLVSQFNSLRRAAIVSLTIPMAIIGVVAGLLLARSYFGFMTLLGIISLSGIVINNAIVLLDRIRIEIEENGREPASAVLTAAQTRLRPILLTAATTVGGLLPLWLGGGPMWEPMAIAIIFGLAFATILTLGVIPVLYTLFFKVDFRSVG